MNKAMSCLKGQNNAVTGMRGAWICHLDENGPGHLDSTNFRLQKRSFQYFNIRFSAQTISIKGLWTFCFHVQLWPLCCCPLDLLWFHWGYLPLWYKKQPMSTSCTHDSKIWSLCYGEIQQNTLGCRVQPLNIVVGESVATQWGLHCPPPNLKKKKVCKH